MARFEDKLGEQDLVASLVDLLYWPSGLSVWAGRVDGDCAARQAGPEALTRKRHIVFSSSVRRTFCSLGGHETKQIERWS